MYVSPRFTVVAFSVLLSVACGSSDPPAATKCTPGQMSLPGMIGDPCKQDSKDCVALHGSGVALCGADSAWAQCVCSVPPAVGMTAGATTTAQACGNGVVEADKGEQCEQGMTGATTCASLMGAGATGLVMCVGCRLDASACMMAVAAAPTTTGGTGPQGGAGH